MYLNSCGGFDTRPVLVVTVFVSVVSISSSSFSSAAFFLEPFLLTAGCLKFFKWSGFFRKHLSQYLHLGRSLLTDVSSVSSSAFFATFTDGASDSCQARKIGYYRTYPYCRFYDRRKPPVVILGIYYDSTHITSLSFEFDGAGTSCERRGCY